MQTKFGRSSKRREVLMHNNFEYWKHRDNLNGTAAWRCTKCVRFHCKARLTTRAGDIISEHNQQHTHEGNNAKTLGRTAVFEMKEKMGDIGATPSSSQGAVSATLPDHVLMALPKGQQSIDVSNDTERK